MTKQTLTRPQQGQTIDQKIQVLRQLYADSPRGKTALENSIPSLKEQLAGGLRYESAGRVGLRQGKVSELTLIFNFVPGGAKRLRGLLRALEANFSAEKVLTVHDMRFVFLDNDTKLLFATAYDGNSWDSYLDEFATKIPDELDLLFSELEEFPGFRAPTVKDWIAKYQVPAEGWYVANPNLTVAETRRLEKVGGAVEELLDKVG
ncbi:hypothetical protein QA640_46605 (plasmid) [Bradyrhizobium sp. CB82]|uniref:hypothetical protein n=1 Tax=Bradyrhizobium sp. CB82 TaxID=3039159 RepID=UPI0024B24700|nr:hypothetical protein [Bradyrhizobium sp. CB82]WFU45488.1 hypothetical protein QA640_46605 [Bradyrhizobium sp. CB82]